MAVMQMDRICVCALKRDRKPLLEFLQRQGTVEVIKTDSGGVFSSTDTTRSCALFEKNARTAATALEILNRHCPADAPLLGFLSGRKAISATESDAFAQRWGERLAAADRLIALEREIAQAQNDILKAEAAEEALVPWLDLPVAQTFKGTARTSAWIGSVQGERTAAQLVAQMTEAVPPIGPVHVEIVRSSKDMTSFYVLSLRRDAKGVEAALGALGFTRPANPPAKSRRGAGAPAREKAEAQGRIDASAAEIRGYEPLRDELRLLEDYRMRAEKIRGAVAADAVAARAGPLRLCDAGRRRGARRAARRAL